MAAKKPIHVMHAPFCSTNFGNNRGGVSRKPEGWGAFEYIAPHDDVGMPRMKPTIYKRLGDAKAHIEARYYVKKWTKVYQRPPRCDPVPDAVPPSRFVATKLLEANDLEFVAFLDLWIRDQWCPAPLADWLRDRDYHGHADCAQWAYSSERILLATDTTVPGHVFPRTDPERMSFGGWTSALFDQTKGEGPFWGHALPGDVYEAMTHTQVKAYDFDTKDVTKMSLACLLDAWAIARS